MALIIGIPLMFIGIFLGFTKPLLVALNGATTVGHYISRGVGAKGTHYVTYRYSVDDIEYRASATVYSDLFERAPDMPKLEVYYARLDPQISYLEPVNWLQILCSGGLMVFFVLGVISGVMQWFSRYRERRTAHRIIPGTLLGVNPIKTPNGILWQIRYEFTSPRTHSPIQGQFTSARRILADRNIPPPNTPLAVVYLDDAVHHPL